eukprot:364787-Chlamydomonas_euryale.AAC.12
MRLRADSPNSWGYPIADARKQSMAAHTRCKFSGSTDWATRWRAWPGPGYLAKYGGADTAELIRVFKRTQTSMTSAMRQERLVAAGRCKHFRCNRFGGVPTIGSSSDARRQDLIYCTRATFCNLKFFLSSVRDPTPIINACATAHAKALSNPFVAANHGRTALS